LSTARVARRLGRPVLAMPGDVDRPTSRGCNGLLRAGAQVCESAADVVRALGQVAVGVGPSAPATVPRSATAAGAPAPSVSARVLEALAAGPLGLEALASRSGVAAGSLISALLELEWAGLVAPLPGQRWTRRDVA
jgi:DNA processing protein